MEKTKKVMAGMASTVLLLAAASCGSVVQEEGVEEEVYYDSYSSETITNDYETESENDEEGDDFSPIPEDEACAEWEWDYDDGVWECEDSSSSYFGHYFYGGTYYNSKSNLYNSAAYIDYQKSSSFKGRNLSNTSASPTSSSTVSDGTAVKGSTGFGSSSTYTGG